MTPRLLAVAQLATPIALPAATSAAARSCAWHSDQAGRGRED